MVRSLFPIPYSLASQSLPYLNQATPIMAQFKHDRFFKQYIQELYQNKGTFFANINLTAEEDLFIDVMFEPNRDLPAWQEQNLGLLDWVMAKSDSNNLIVEHYSHYFEGDDFDKCLLRSLLNKTKEAKRKDRKSTFTWVLTARLSEPKSREYGVKPYPQAPANLQPSTPDRPSIVYICDAIDIAIIVIERLPLNEETMWLKLLGKESDCKAAYQAIRTAPRSRVKSATLKACHKFNAYINSLPVAERTEEDMVILRSIETIDRDYTKDVDDWLAKGQLDTVRKFLTARFGEVSPDLDNKLANLSSAELDRLLVESVDWQSIEDLEKYLGNRE
jgi:hypothetical protein